MRQRWFTETQAWDRDGSQRHRHGTEMVHRDTGMGQRWFTETLIYIYTREGVCICTPGHHVLCRYMGRDNVSELDCSSCCLHIT